MKITVDKDTTLLELLERSFPESNRTHLKKTVKYGCVFFQGGVVRSPGFILRKGQEVEYKKYQGREISKAKAPFRILYEDDYVMVVFKPAGILSSGRTTEKVRSMFSMVNRYVQQNTRGRLRAYTVHRLDREVSGLLMFAKSEDMKYYLQEHWKEVDKVYYALVTGVPPQERGVIESWLKENSRQTVYSVPNEQEGAKWAVTHYKTEKYFTWGGQRTSREQADFSLLKVQLETGRKNQIRVHLSELGCPIVGDVKYGADYKVKRIIRLLSFVLDFPHPVLKRRIHVEIPLPSNFVVVGRENEY